MIFSTHRLTSVVEMDEIIVISGGKAIERGSHAQLLAANGAYRRLWDDQGHMPHAPANQAGDDSDDDDEDDDDWSGVLRSGPSQPRIRRTTPIAGERKEPGPALRVPIGHRRQSSPKQKL